MAEMETWSSPPPTTRQLPGAEAEQPLLVYACARPSPQADRDKGDPRSACSEVCRLRLGQELPISTAASGTKRASTRASSRALEDFERPRARSSRRPTCARRSTAHRRSATTSACPTAEVFHVHGTSGTTGRPDRLRHRARRLARDRQRARPHHVGHGHASGRHRDLHRGGLQPVHGQLGRARGRRAAARQGVPVRRRRAGHERNVLVQWLAHDEAGKAFYGTPSLRDPPGRRRRVEEKLKPARLRHRSASSSRGEPGASGARRASDRIASRPMRPKVYDCGSMAEMSPFMNVAGSAQSPPWACCAGRTSCYTEVCDPATLRARAVRPARHAGLHAPRAHERSR
jgi:phenylacetate-CoA ligase